MNYRKFPFKLLLGIFTCMVMTCSINAMDRDKPIVGSDQEYYIKKVYDLAQRQQQLNQEIHTLEYSIENKESHLRYFSQFSRADCVDIKAHNFTQSIIDLNTMIKYLQKEINLGKKEIKQYLLHLGMRHDEAIARGLKLYIEKEIQKIQTNIDDYKKKIGMELENLVVPMTQKEAVAEWRRRIVEVTAATTIDHSKPNEMSVMDDVEEEEEEEEEEGETVPSMSEEEAGKKILRKFWSLGEIFELDSEEKKLKRDLILLEAQLVELKKKIREEE